ncbi:hypothetical protein HPB49_020687 [Dermacentor silvarum]|uniref:Uncharacterized protein n=1 Tax=Dermacentor silvarum TaxID=543639 RepID=A0ACB8DKJ4_DERSI|nr:hypothetical protein HPB49_020687 [Dermacentor silvarum]
MKASTGLKVKSYMSGEWTPPISRTRKLYQPAVGAVPLGIGPTPAPAPNETSAASAVPLTDGARTPHECKPRCALCAGPHVSADRCSKERYRPPPPKSPTPPPEGQAGPKKPHPPSPKPKPTAKGDLSWATRVRQGPQVSGSGGAASPPPPSTIPHPKPLTPSTPTREQIAIRQLQAQVTSLTQAVEALATRWPSANTTPSGQAPEAIVPPLNTGTPQHSSPRLRRVLEA